MRNIRSCLVGIYALRGRQIACGVCLGIVCTLGVSELFYDSMAYALFVSVPMAVIVMGFFRGMTAKNRMQAAVEFQELLSHISAGLYAGSSLEHSYMRGVAALKEQHVERMVLSGPLEEGVARLKLNVPVTQVLEGIAVQTELEDAMHFARITAAAQKSGGNLIHIITQAAGHISEKQKTDREIAVMISGKKTEQSVMCVMPFAIMLYMKLTSPGYFDVLYHNPFGVMFMSACLCMILLAYLLGSYMVDIKM